MNFLTSQPFNPSEALAKFTEECAGAGGIVSFLGCVRPTSTKGRVHKLHLEAYPAMTERGIRAAVRQAKTSWSLTGVRIIHRTGDVFVGEPIVFVAAASVHRRDSFEAADFLMDYLKTEAIFWKKETTDLGETWIEPRDQDYSDALRWGKLESETT